MKTGQKALSQTRAPVLAKEVNEEAEAWCGTTVKEEKFVMESEEASLARKTRTRPGSGVYPYYVLCYTSICFCVEN